MQANWRIGELFGIPLFIDYSWFFILALVTFVNAMDFYPAWGSVLAICAGLAMALLLFGSVLLHELGHSLVARSQGIKVNSITLFLFGGVAEIEQESKTPGEAFQVAIAGPAVSILLFGLFYGLTAALHPAGLVRVLADDLARINLVLALFNLIPGLPLDGGQILKAAVWKLTGNRFQGVRWAARTGKFLGICAIALGLFTVLLTGEWGAIWTALIGWFVFRNASNYDRVTTLQEALLQLVASNAMTRDFRVVDADMTLRQFADEYILKEHQINPHFLNQTSSELSKKDRFTVVGSNTVGEDFAELTPVEKKEPTPFDEAGSRQQGSSSTLEDDGKLCVSSIDHAWTSQETNQVYPYYAASDGRYRGLVAVEDLHYVERSRWETQTLDSIVRSLTEIVTVEENAPLVEVINRMEANQLKRITVLSPAGAIAGVIDRGDTVRAVASKLNIPITDAEIKRIKAEGSYPPALQLQAIALATTQ